MSTFNEPQHGTQDKKEGARIEGWATGHNPVIPNAQVKSGPGMTEAMATNDGAERMMAKDVGANPVIGSVKTGDEPATENATVMADADGRAFGWQVKGAASTGESSLAAGSKGSGGTAS